MCPTEQTDEEVVREAEEAVLEKEGQDELTEKAVEDIVEVSEEEEAEFEGVDKIEDIPKGKEKDYGI